jgi:hypothetical protein
MHDLFLNITSMRKFDYKWGVDMHMHVYLRSETNFSEQYK